MKGIAGDAIRNRRGIVNTKNMKFSRVSKSVKIRGRKGIDVHVDDKIKSSQIWGVYFWGINVVVISTNGLSWEQERSLFT